MNHTIQIQSLREGDGKYWVNGHFVSVETYRRVFDAVNRDSGIVRCLCLGELSPV